MKELLYKPYLTIVQKILHRDRLVLVIKFHINVTQNWYENLHKRPGEDRFVRGSTTDSNTTIDRDPFMAFEMAKTLSLTNAIIQAFSEAGRCWLSCEMHIGPAMGLRQNSPPAHSTINPPAAMSHRWMPRSM